MSSRARSRVRFRASVMVLAGLAAGCQYLNRAVTDVTSEPAGCLDDANALRDRTFSLERQLEARLRAALNGAMHLERAAALQADKLNSLCVALSRELDTAQSDTAQSDTAQSDTAQPQSAQRRSQLACDRTIERIREIRKNAEANLTVERAETRCAGSLGSYASCARACDSDLPPGQVQVECAPSAQWGRCSGKCEGQCVQRFGDCHAQCDGRCEGACSEDFYGSCGGRCVGTCDLQNVNGRCEGQCDGKCLSEANGKCGGQCRGKCQGACTSIAKKQRCDGICAGECDVAMAAAQCAEMIAPPEMLPACRAMCEAKQLESSTCMGGRSQVSIYFANDMKAAERLQRAIDGRAQELVELAEAMKPNIESALSRVLAAIEEVSEELQEEREKETVGTCVTEAESKQEQAAKDFAAVQATAESVLGSLQG